MRNWKRRLALLLTAVLLISALPLNAAAAEDLPPEEEAASVEEVLEEVVFRVGTLDVIATSDPEKPGSEDEDGNVLPYVPFEDDGSYTIILPVGEATPYTVWFLVDGREFPYVFGTESDTTTIGGHEFRVQCQEMPEIPEDEQLFVTVGGEQIPLIPEDVPTTISMMPLTEKRYSLNLTGRFPSELKEFGISDILTKASTENTTSEQVAAWAKWGYYDEDGNQIAASDDYTLVGDEKVIDLSYSGNTYNIQLELIIGTVDQLNPNNQRYIISVTVSPVSNLNPFTFTFEDAALSDPIYSNYYYEGYYYVDGQKKGEYRVTVKSESNWDGDSPVALKLKEEPNFWRTFNADKNLTYEIYEGYHKSADGLTGSVKAGFTGDGLTKDYHVDNIDDRPAFTAVFSRDGKVVHVMPFYIDLYKNVDHAFLNGYLFEETADGRFVEVANSNESLKDPVTGLRQTKYVMLEGKDPNGEYYARANFRHNDQSVNNQIKDYVKKTVDGYYKTEAEATGTDITDDLFGGNGYKANYSNGKTFTIILKNGTIQYLSLKTVAYEAPVLSLPDAPDPLSEDTYFRMERAMQGEEGSETRLDAYIMPYDADSYYYNGFQTVFLLDGSSPVAENSRIKPVFWTGNKKVVMFAGHNKDGHTDSAERQESGKTEHEFKNGEAILYSAAAENGANLKNYWVTFVTQQTGGAKLFVNGTNDETHKDEATGNPIREVMLTEAYGNHHDIFFANIGDQEMTGLTVTLTDAQNIALDDYWDIGDTKTLAPFTTTTKTTTYGELANVAKIRLVPEKDENGNIKAGDIKGTLTISSTNGGSVTIKLTGKSGAPKIVTDKIRDGIKFVHYSSLIQTNYMYGTGDIEFKITSGRLPNGMQIKPNGEIYGVPTEVGEFTIGVTATNKTSNLSDSKTYTFKIEPNTNDNVEAANMDDQGYLIDTRLPDNITGALTSQDQLFVSVGEYNQFMNVYLDGRELTPNTDYTSEEGSTKITVRSQTFRNAGNGTHTISAEFRTGHSTSGTMKRTAQNFTISGLSTPSYNPGSSSGGSSSGGGSSSSNRRPSSGTPKPSTKPSTPAQTPATSTEPKTTAERFSDISAQQWFYPDVDWAFKNNLMLGVTDSAYHPYDKISSITGVVVLSRMEKVDLSQQPLAEGIPDGQWYTPAASWAKSIGILPEGPFQGSAAMSRGEMAVMLLKYLKHLDVDCTLLGGPVTFTDASMMTQEQNDAFQVLYQFGIFKGVGNQTMDVSGSTTRAQFAALLHRLSVFAEAQQKDA